jgi:hypothetical protein
MRMTVRRRPWPLNAACIAIAMARPRANSKVTLTAVNTRVVPIALQNSEFPRASV